MKSLFVTECARFPMRSEVIREIRKRQQFRNGGNQEMTRLLAIARFGRPVSAMNDVVHSTTTP